MCLIYQISSPSLDSVQAFGIVNSLFLETQPIPISILPLDLRDSVNILSTMLTLLNTNLQQGGGTDVLNTMVSSIYTYVQLYVIICMFLHV